MTDNHLTHESSALDIRAAFARAKVYALADLPGHDALRQAAIRAARNFPNFNHTERSDLSRCPLLFADEPELALAWARGAARELQAGIDMQGELAQDARDAASERFIPPAHLLTKAACSLLSRAELLTSLAAQLDESLGAEGQILGRVQTVNRELAAQRPTAAALALRQEKYLFPDDAIGTMPRAELLTLIESYLKDAHDMTDGSDYNSDVRIDYAQDMIEQARDALLDGGYIFTAAERARLGFLTWPLTPAQAAAKVEQDAREQADREAYRAWRESIEAKFSGLLELAMRGEALPPEADFTGLQIDVGWSSWQSSASGETTMRPSGADVRKMVETMRARGFADACLAAYTCSRAGVTFDTDPGPAWTINFSVPASAAAWQLLRTWWDEHRIQSAPYVWYHEPGKVPARFCHWSLPGWPLRAAPEQWMYGRMGKLLTEAI